MVVVAVRVEKVVGWAALDSVVIPVGSTEAVSVAGVVVLEY